MNINYYKKIIIINTIKATIVATIAIMAMKQYTYYISIYNNKKLNEIKNEIKINIFELDKLKNNLKKIKIEKKYLLKNEINIIDFNKNINKYIYNINKDLKDNIITFKKIKTIKDTHYLNVVHLIINFDSSQKKIDEILKKIFNIKLKNIYIKKLNGYFDEIKIKNKTIFLSFKQKEINE